MSFSCEEQDGHGVYPQNTARSCKLKLKRSFRSKPHQRDALIILKVCVFFQKEEKKIRKNLFFISRTECPGKVSQPPPLCLCPVPPQAPPGAQALTFSSTSLRSCSHSRLSGFVRFCVKSRVSLRDSP